MRNLVVTAVLLGLLVAPAQAGAVLTAADIEKRLQPLLDEYAQAFNMSFSVGVAGAGGLLAGAASGVNDQRHPRDSRVSTRTLYPMGSVTKPITATAVMQLHEAGALDLDAPVHVLIDPFLRRTNGTTLLELWNGDASIQRVTARHLLGMRSGIMDYDYGANEAWSVDPAHNGVDLSPYDYLHNVNKSFAYAPGQGGSYSSVGYVLAGVLLAAATNASTVFDYDQRDAWRLAVRAGRLPAGVGAALDDGITFPRGACSAQPRIVRQYYASLARVSASTVGVRFRDMTDEGCLNGWTMGNGANTPTAAAAFMYHLLLAGAGDGALLSASSRAAMQAFVPMTTGWFPGMQYGLGLMNSTNAFQGSRWPVAVKSEYLGVIEHPGEDYGSAAPLNSCNAALGLCVNLATNALYGMNCSQPESYGLNFQARSAAHCAVYAALYDLVTGGGAGQIECGQSSEAGSRRLRGGAAAAAGNAATGDSYVCLDG